MPVLDHVHTYALWKTSPRGKPIIRGGEEQMKCIDPDCTHFAPKSLVAGKRSICTKCRKNEIVLDREAMRRHNPMCLECSKTKEGEAMREAQEMVKDIFDDLDNEGNEFSGLGSSSEENKEDESK